MPPLMNRTGALNAGGPLGRNPTVERVFGRCACDAETRNGRCTDGKQHRRWEAKQTQQAQTSSGDGSQQS